MVANDAFTEIRVAAQVIFDMCASYDETYTKLERVSYASAAIQPPADESRRNVENDKFR